METLMNLSRSAVRWATGVAALALSVTAAAQAHLPLIERSGVLPDGQRWQITIPANFNGTLVNDLDRIGNSNRANFLLPNGYAYTGTARHADRDVNWNPRAESNNMVKVLDLFEAEFGRPARIIQFGCSGGGSTALSVAEDHPTRFDGVIPMHATSPLTLANMRLDLTFALKALLDPDGTLPVIVSAEPTAAAETAWINALNAAQQTSQGRARMALAGVLAQYPAWGSQYNPLPPKPDQNDPAAVQTALLRAVLDGTRRSITARPQWDQPAGVMSWNIGIDYKQFYANGDPSHKQIVNDLYSQAGLTEQAIQSDLDRVNRAPRIAAQPQALAYWRERTHSGVIGVPMLHAHGVGDAGTPAANVSSYRDSVVRAGKTALYRQAFIDGAGHCTFNAAEMAALVTTMVQRLTTGSWGTSTNPDELNAVGSSFALGTPRFLTPGAATGWTVPPKLNRAFFPDTKYPRAMACADLSAARAAIGARRGNPKFNAIVDLDVNNVVDVRDVAAIGRLVPAGTVCK
jgi:pimeloyl-ACP methyl ester carboxylesterase